MSKVSQILEVVRVNKAGASSITVEGRNALESLPADRKVRL